MPLSLAQFNQQLVESGLMSADDVEAVLVVVRAEKQPRDGEQLARLLVKQKKLTSYQARAVYEGKTQGLVLGNYVILDKLGEGGMGMVLKAQHQRMNRVVALKVLTPALVKRGDALKRFLREVQAAAKLNHPNIVSALDADEAKGVHFLVMEYVEGTDLSVLVKKNGPFPVEKAVTCILQAARGLEFAHQKGVIHRDIKPANLLLDLSGTVKILDMGLARIDGADAQHTELTNTGAVMGTVDYMSPEQALNTKHADQRADIYSLGISLWYLLTGKAAYPGDSLMEKLLAHREQPIPSLMQARKDVPETLDVIFRRMVAKRAEDRFQSMTDVIRAFETGEIVGGPAPSLSLGPGDDTKFSEFIRNLEQEAMAPTSETRPTTGLVAHPAEIPSENTAVSGTGSSDTNEELTASSRSPAARKRGATVAQAWWKNHGLAIGGGTAAALLLAGIFFAISSRERQPNADSRVPSTNRTVDNNKAGQKNGWHGWPTDAPPPAIAAFDAVQARKHQEAWAKYLRVPFEYTNSLGMKFVLIPPGEFTMGSAPAEIEDALVGAGADKNWQEQINSAGPQHKVILSQPIYLGVHEVTQAQYEKVMGQNPSAFAATGSAKGRITGLDTSSHPVEKVSWNDAAEFCTKLSENEKRKPFSFRIGDNNISTFDGTGYRLPTEAEWEFACRAGTTTKHWSGDQAEQIHQVAWFIANSGIRSHSVGELKANPFGLHDIHGNLREWVQDQWEPTYYSSLRGKPAIDPSGPSSANSLRVNRGGCWSDNSASSASRAALGHLNSDSSIGFRVALTVGTGAKTSSAVLVDYALAFDGNGVVELDGGFTYKPDSCTIEAYVRVDARSPRAEIFSLSNKGVFGLDVDDGNNWRLTHTMEPRGHFGTDKTPPIEFGRRYHVAGVCDTDFYYIYVDGKRIAKSRPRRDITLTAGTRPSRIGFRFFGTIDDVRVSSKARYTANFTPPARHESDADTVALYHCDEGSGSTLRDSSGHNYHGRIDRAKWVRVDDRPITSPATTPSESKRALQFTGAGDHVLFPDLTGPAEAVTIEGWFRLDSDKDMSLITLPYADATGLVRLTVANGGPQAVRVGDKRNGVGYSRSGVLPVGEYFHLATGYTGTTWVFWLNGKKIGEGADHYGWMPPVSRLFPPIAGADNAVPLSSGQRRAPFQGAMRELRISKTARYKTDFTPDESLVADQNTLALYHCDEGTGDVLTDSSGNDHHGKIVGAKWSSVKMDASDYSLQFDGVEGGVEIPGLEYDGVEITLEARVRMGRMTAEGREIIAMIGATRHVSLWGYPPLAGITVIDPSANRVALCPWESLDRTQPIDLAGVWDGNQTRIFVNGRLVGTDSKVLRGTKKDEKRSVAPKSYIGGPKGVFGSSFDGIIDEVRISKTARYKSDYTVPPRLQADEHTLALYHFDEGTGDTLRDSSGNNRHGRIVGAKWVSVTGEATPDSASSPRLAVAPFDAEWAKQHQLAWAAHLGTTVETTNSVGANMVLIPPGEFMMGSTDEQVAESLRIADETQADPFARERIEKTERPRHRVVITRPFLVGATEVTVGQFSKFVEAAGYVTELERNGYVGSGKDPPDEKALRQASSKSWRTPGYNVTDDLPVTHVNWNDATAFCNWLTEQEQATYRLPTEAEWEYACRAGTTTLYSFGDDVELLAQNGWYAKNAAKGPRAVGLKPANAFGLHDMHGNLDELCLDVYKRNWYAETPQNDPVQTAGNSTHVVRGGSWNYHAPTYFRSASRSFYYLTSPATHNNYGFRIAREFDAAKR